MLVPGKFFQPYQMFIGKTRILPWSGSGVLERWFTLVGSNQGKLIDVKNALLKRPRKRTLRKKMVFYNLGTGTSRWRWRRSSWRRRRRRGRTLEASRTSRRRSDAKTQARDAHSQILKVEQIKRIVNKLDRFKLGLTAMAQCYKTVNGRTLRMFLLS